MRNILLVAQHEFIINIRKKSFLFAVFGVPIMMMGIFALVFWVQSSAEESGIVAEHIGYVDQAQLIRNENPMFLSYDDTDSAQVALDNGEIDFYFVVPSVYISTGTIQLYTPKTVAAESNAAIQVFLVENLTAQIETDAPAERMLDPVNLEIFLDSSQKQLTETGFIGLLITPFLFVTVLIMALQLSSTYLMSGVVEEKKNHIMEILITSIKPYELLTGKLIGLGLLGLLQMVVWLGLGYVAATLGGQIEILSGVSVPPDFIAITLVYFLFTYFLFSSILAGIGAVVSSEQESRTIAGVVSLILALPYFFIVLLLTNPESGVFTFFLFFPMTSAMTYLLLYPFLNVPLWQVGLSLLILAVSTFFITWASARVFRWALLFSGKLPNPFVLLRVIRGKQEIGSLAKSNSQKEGAV